MLSYISRAPHTYFKTSTHKKTAIPPSRGFFVEVIFSMHIGSVEKLKLYFGRDKIGAKEFFYENQMLEPNY